MKQKIKKLKQKKELVKARTQLLGQKINLANRRRQLEKIQLRGLNISPPNLGTFIQRGSDLTNYLFGLRKRKSRRR